MSGVSKQKQIPFGDDQKGNGNGKNKSNGNVHVLTLLDTSTLALTGLMEMRAEG